MNVNTVGHVTRTVCIGLASLLCALAGAAHADHLIDWKVVDVGALRPDGQTIATAVNNRGQVVGYTSPPSATANGSHAFIWQDGTLRDIGTIPGSITSIPLDINGAGEIVGQADGGALTWKDGTWTPLGFVGQARAIDRAGDIAGTMVVGAHEHAVLVRDGVMMDLGTLGGLDSRGSAINDSGHVVGVATRDDGSQHAFLWANGSMRDLGTIAHRNSIATGINNRNVVVGFTFDDGGSNHTAFLWYGRMFRLLPGITHVAPIAINNRNDIVGVLEDEGVAFLVADGELVRLDDLPAVRAAGLANLQPYAINDRRWIVGTADGPSGARGFVLMPDPPASPAY